jgi:hypothetical protein
MTDRLHTLLTRAPARPHHQPDLAGLRGRAARARARRRLAGGAGLASVLLLGSAVVLALDGGADDAVVLRDPPAEAAAPTPAETPMVDPEPEPAAGGADPAAIEPPSPGADTNAAPSHEPEDPDAGVETTEWCAVSLHEEIGPAARSASAQAPLDPLVANMRVDSISAQELRVRLNRDEGGWFVEPAAEGRATCRRGVDGTDPARCV